MRGLLRRTKSTQTVKYALFMHVSLLFWPFPGLKTSNSNASKGFPVSVIFGGFSVHHILIIVRTQKEKERKGKALTVCKAYQVQPFEDSKTLFYGDVGLGSVRLFY